MLHTFITVLFSAGIRVATIPLIIIGALVATGQIDRLIEGGVALVHTFNMIQ